MPGDAPEVDQPETDTPVPAQPGTPDEAADERDSSVAPAQEADLAEKPRRPEKRSLARKPPVGRRPARRARTTRTTRARSRTWPVAGAAGAAPSLMTRVRIGCSG